nr:PREDICTED: myomesin-3 [Lepisosteus oculatus]
MASKTLIHHTQEEQSDQMFHSLQTSSTTTKKKFKSSDEEVTYQEFHPFVSPEVMSMKELLNFGASSRSKPWEYMATAEERQEREKRTLFGNEVEKLEVAVILDQRIMRRRVDRKALRRKAQEKAMVQKNILELRKMRPPDFLIPLRSHSVWEQMDVKLSCTVQGCPEPEVTWYKDGIPLQRSSLQPWKHKIQKMYGLHTLEIKRCTPDDSGEYRIVITSCLGTASSYAMVFVNSCHGPQSGYDHTQAPIAASEKEADFEAAFKPSFAKEGEAFTLSCGFSSALLAHQRGITWLRDGVPLKESEGIEINTGPSATTLTVKEMHKEHEGVYTICLPAASGVKEHSAYIYVKDAAAAVVGAPGSPLSVECRDVHKDYVFVTWTPPSADGGGPVFGYYIDRCDVETGEWVQCNETPHKFCRYPVFGLLDGKSYLFRVRAVNNAGIGRPSKSSNPVTMTDPAEASRIMVVKLDKGKEIIITKDELEADILVPLPPTGVHASESSESYVILSWAEPDPRGREHLSYYIEQSVAGSNSWMMSNLDIPVNSPRFPVFDLQKGRSYLFRVRSVNKYGVSDPSDCSEPISLKEKTALPPPAHGIVAYRDTDTSVLLQWEEPKNAQDIIGYYVYSCEAGTDKWLTVNNKPVNGNRFAVHGLTPWKSYVFKVKSVSAAGSSEYSEQSAPIVVKAAISPPSPPLAIALLNCGSTEMVIGWRAPARNGGSAIQGYFLDQMDTSELVWHEVNVKPTSERVYKVCSLQEGHSYQFRAFAMNIVGIGKPSEPSSPFLCQEWNMPEPGCPYDVTCREVRRDSLVLLWEKPLYGGHSPITGYMVEMCEGREPEAEDWKAVVEKPTVGTYLKVSGLDAGRIYKFRVSAVNSAGVGQPSLPSEEIRAEIKPGVKDIEIGVDEDGFIFLAFESPEMNDSSQFIWAKNYRDAIDAGRVKIESKHNRSRLIFTNPSEKDLGLYTVEISDINDISSSYAFTEKDLERLLKLSWQVRNPLIGLVSGWEVEVFEKGDVRLWLQVEKLSPAAELRLIFNDQEITSSPTRKINFDRAKGLVEILIDPFSDANEGSYTAQLKDGRAKNQFTLVLVDDKFRQTLAQAQSKRRDWKRKCGPYFLEFLSWKVTENCDLHFSCKVTNTKKDTSLKWYKDGTEIPQIEYNPQTGICTLTIPQVTIKDIGVYKAVLSDDRGEDISTVDLVDQEFEKLQQELCRQCALSAGPLEVQPTAEGFKLYCSLKYYLDYMKTSWYFKEKKLGSEARTQAGSSMNKVWLEIFNPTESDRGKYTLEMFDGRDPHRRTLDLSGQVFADALMEHQRLKQAAIAEKNRARVTKGLPDVVAIMENKSLCLTCFTAGDPTPEVFWMKNEREIVTGEQYKITTSAGCSSITINQVTAEDSGKYSIFVRNKHGTQTEDVTVSVYKYGEKPSAGALEM